MTIAENIRHIKQLIDTTLHTNGRPQNSAKLLAVSKSQPASAIKEAYLAGQCDFGENYWQEAHAKQCQLKDLPINWHFIGALQSKKIKEIAPNFAWVHSVDRKKSAELLALHRPTHLPLLNICLQVNLDNEKNKAGVLAEELPGLITEINQLPNLQIRGLMAIPKPCLTEQQQYASFKRLTALLKQTNNQLNLMMDTLSMGMSDDFIAALQAGSTCVRIGRALFGERHG